MTLQWKYTPAEDAWRAESVRGYVYRINFDVARQRWAAMFSSGRGLYYLRGHFETREEAQAALDLFIGR